MAQMQSVWSEFLAWADIPALSLIAAAMAAAVASWFVHRAGAAVLQRLTRGMPVTSTVVRFIRPAARWWLLFVALQLVWQGAPNDMRWIEGIRHINSVLLLLSLTWVALRAVAGVAQGVIDQHPLNVVDNLQARRIHTQTRVLSRTVMVLIGLAGVALMLMTFPGARQFGTSLLASAGVVGLVAGMAAQPVFGNLIAGLQIALAQPIRLDDVVIVEGEWGRIEEISSTYVVVRIWDERRMVVPLSWFIENPFQNWTRSTAQMLGTAFLWLDYRTPMDQVRAELERICHDDPRWDGRVCIAQVTETSEHVMQVRLLVSARDSGEAFDLRCAVRERMIAFLAEHHPQALPRLRAQVERHAEAAGASPAQLPAADIPSSPRAEDVDDLPATP